MIRALDDYNIRTEEELAEMQYIFSGNKPQESKGVDYVDVGLPLNTNVLRICLNMREQKIAQVIVHKCEIAADEAMIIRAIKT